MDEHNNPIGTPPPEERDQLSLEFELRLNGAVDRLREVNESDLRSIGERVYGPQITFWKKVTLGTVIVTVLGSIWGFLKVPEIIENKTKAYIENNLVGSALTNTVNQVISNRTVQFVEYRLAPLSNSVGELSHRFATQAEELEKAQELLRQRLEVQDLLVRAKGGSLAAYRMLQGLQTNSTTSESAKAAITEVGFFFDAWVKQEVDYSFTDTVSRNPYDLSIEELAARLTEPALNAEGRMIAAFRIRRFGKKNTVEPLAEALTAETNLYAASQMVRSLSELTGKKFHVLDMDGALAWWSNAKTDTNFQSAYRGFCKFGGMTVFNSETRAEEIVAWMNETIEREPSATKARCIRGFYFLVLGEASKGDADFAEVEKRSPGSPDLHFYKGIVLAARGDTNGAVSSLKRCLESRPSLRSFIPSALLEKLTNSPPPSALDRTSK